MLLSLHGSLHSSSEMSLSGKYQLFIFFKVNTFRLYDENTGAVRFEKVINLNEGNIYCGVFFNITSNMALREILKSFQSMLDTMIKVSSILATTFLRI